MPLCKDCEHYDAKSKDCLRSHRTDPINGAALHFQAVTERIFEVSNGCGPAGKFFEPVPVLKPRSDGASKLALGPQSDAEWDEAYRKDHEETHAPLMRFMTEDERLDDPRHTPYNFK